VRPDVLVPAQVNWSQWRPGRRRGHYESFYQRANHPHRLLAFWLRYTVFSPTGHPEAALGELWAVVFDGETGEHAVARTEHPIGACRFAPDQFDVRLPQATLGPAALRGRAEAIAWDLRYHGGGPPLYLLPRPLYATPFPPAKSLVGVPLATYDGAVTVGAREIPVEGWLGSQNHNWGSRHTDRYAFGQVSGFDGEPDTFLEVATAQNRVGPVRTPPLTLLVLRRGGEQIAVTALREARRASASVDYRSLGRNLSWTFATASATTRIEGRIEAPRSAFVGLRYRDPPGGEKHCLNTKIARCTLAVVDVRSRKRQVLRSGHGALFEILTDERAHGVPIRA
jgi:hypothetical protein